VEGQFYITTIAGLGVSLAGFSAVLTLFRAGQQWDPVTLWRARTIVRTSLSTAIAMLTSVPAFYLVNSEAAGIRTGCFFLLVTGLADSISMGPKRQPEAWPDRKGTIPFFAVTFVLSAAMAVNLVIANLGVFLAVGLFNLTLPMTVFIAVVNEFRPGDENPS
jgi:uncharacterized membrane-anchored protein